MAWRRIQHIHMYSVAVTMLPALYHALPVTLSHLLPCPVPRPLLFCSLLAFPALPLPPLSAMHPSPVLHYQLSDPLLQSPGFPRSSLHVALFLTLNKLILPNRPVSFPVSETNPAAEHLTIPRLQLQLSSSKESSRKHPTTVRS